jgi:hypothetical protein
LVVLVLVVVIDISGARFHRPVRLDMNSLHVGEVPCSVNLRTSARPLAPDSFGGH